MSTDGKSLAPVLKKLYRGEKKQCGKVGYRLFENNFCLTMRFKKITKVRESIFFNFYFD